MRRRAVLAGLAAVALAEAAGAQSPRSVRVGWLTVAPHPFIESFREGMRALGYVEGDNLTIEYRYPVTTR